MSSNTNIGNTPVNQGYVQLIHTGETGGIDGTLRTLYDGDGTASDLQIASNKVKINTELYIGSKTATEFIQDIVGDMFTTGSYTNITTTYDDTNGNIDLSSSGEVTLTGTETLTNKTLASPTLTGTANGVNITLSGDLTVNGTTTTVNQTNLDVSDNIIGLNRGASSNANDSGLIIERGSTGDNVFIGWDESADRVVFGVTSATPDSTGDLTIVNQPIQAARLFGDVTGDVTGSASLNLLISSNLSDLNNASTARTNLGLGTIATQASSSVSITGGSITGITDLAIADGGTGASNAHNARINLGLGNLAELNTINGALWSGVDLAIANGGTGASTADVARENLGLEIGLNVQAYDVGLLSIAGLTTSANKMIYTTASDTYATTTLSATARTLLDDNTTADMLTTLGLTATATELNYTDGVTSNIQTQLNGKLGTSAKAADSELLDGINSTSFVQTSRSITPVSQRGISGGGDLSADRTIELSASQLASVALTTSDQLILFDQNDSDIPKRFSAQDIFDTISGAVTSYTNTGNDRVLTSGGGTTINGESELTYSGGLLDISGSLYSIIRLNETDVTNNPAWWTVADGGNYSIRLNNTGTYPFQITTNASNDAVDSITLGYSTSILGNLTLNDSLTIGSGGNYAAGSIYSDSNWGMLFRAKQASPGQAEFRWANSADSELMRIDSSGNVGIGVNSPSTKLQVAGHTRISGVGNGLYFDTTGSNESNVIATINDYETLIATNRGSAGFGVIGNSDIRLGFGTSYNAAETKLYINGSSGNVGIGTATPDANLVVASSSGATIKLQDTGSHAFSLVCENNSNFLNFKEGGGTSILSIDGSNQRVGIGTSSPSAKLDVAGNIEINNSSDPKITFQEGSLTKAEIVADNEGSAGGSLEFFTRVDGGSSTEKMRISAAGNVGIGTTSPTAKLDVRGNVSFFSSDASDFVSFTHSDNGIIINSAGSTSNKMTLNTGGTTALTIDASQNVGIGTTSPKTKLDVENTTAPTLSNDTHAGEAIFLRSGGSAGDGNVQAVLAFGKADGSSRRSGSSIASVQTDSDTDKVGIGFYTSDSSASSQTMDLRMLLNHTGNLHVDADVVAYSTSVSDERLKDNVKTIDNALDKVMKLRGVEFDWNKGNRVGQKDLGLIAQEVEKVLPEIVREKKMAFIDNEIYKTIDYDKVVGVLIEAIKEQQKQIEELKNG